MLQKSPLLGAWDAIPDFAFCSRRSPEVDKERPRPIRARPLARRPQPSSLLGSCLTCPVRARRPLTPVIQCEQLLPVRFTHQEMFVLLNFSVCAGLVALLACSACGSYAPNTNASDPINVVGTTTSDTAGVQIVEHAPNSAALMTGIDCRNKMWDPVPTAERAIEVLKAQAKSVGKSKVMVRSVQAHASPISINCWSAMEATGLVY